MRQAISDAEGGTSNNRKIRDSDWNQILLYRGLLLFKKHLQIEALEAIILYKEENE